MAARVSRTGAAALAVAAALCGPAAAFAESAGQDSTMMLEGGADGTVFKRMTIEGEDRFRIEFERPALRIDLDPAAAPGLDWDNTWEVLAGGAVDLRAPLLRLPTLEPSPYLPRPWLDGYASGEIVRFRPALTDVERWRLTIADSRSGEVRVFEGKGNPPDRIGWDGRSRDGAPMPPGYTYSYVVEAWDRAGNKRNFVGKGFALPAYRLSQGERLVFMITGSDARSGAPGRGVARCVPAPAVLEAASRINQERGAAGVVRVTVTARTYDQANALAGEIADSLGSLLLGGPARIRHIAEVRDDAPERGTVAIVLEPEA